MGALEEKWLGATWAERDNLRALQGDPCRRMLIFDDCNQQPARIGTKVDLTRDTELLGEPLRCRLLHTSLIRVPGGTQPPGSLRYRMPTG